MSLQSEPTTSQLRRDIDRGRTGDTIDQRDPAAAPLGPDGVAAGPDAAAEAVSRTGSPMILAVLAIVAVAVVALVVWSVLT